MATVTTEWQWIDLFKSVVKKNWNGIDLTLLNIVILFKIPYSPIGCILNKKKVTWFLQKYIFLSNVSTIKRSYSYVMAPVVL